MRKLLYTIPFMLISVLAEAEEERFPKRFPDQQGSAVGPGGVATGDIDLNTGGYQLILDAGTANNPAICFGDDDDGSCTGLYRSGADTLSLVSNGADILQIGSQIKAKVRITDPDDQLTLGGACTDGHSQGTGDVCIGGSGQVDGILWADSDLVLGGDISHTGLMAIELTIDAAAPNNALLYLKHSGSAVEFTGSSGTQYGLRMLSEIAQSGTAAHKAIFVNITSGSSGSGQDYLLDLQWGGSPMFTVEDDGDTTITGDLTVTGTISAGGQRGMVYDQDNTDAFAISAQTNLHAYHTNGAAGSNLSGWTHDSGGTAAISAVVDGGGGEITVTTGAPHGLSVGDIISQSNLTDAAYEGLFVVNLVDDTTHYDVTAVYTATDTGTMDKAGTLTADAGSAGDYAIIWGASGTTATNNETFDFELCINASLINGSRMRRKFGIATDFGSMGAPMIVTVADGDKISFALRNNDSAGNITMRNLTFILFRI